MTLIIAAILIVGFVLIATEKLTNVNKAAVAIFVGTLGWILYVSFGMDYVTSQHPHEFTLFLNGAAATSAHVNEYIAHDIFLKYVGRAAEIVLFLLATMTIVEILQNNGCFDFIPQLMRTRSSKKLLWVVAATTFVISANLDNLTTTVMMLTIIRGVVRSRRQRVLLGGAVVISANVGGVLTVIGEPTGLVMWNSGFVTATDYSLSMALPCLLAWAIPVWWIGRSLTGRADLEWITMPYRGDDTNLNVWQRLVMLLVGIGGLWFIPTFHNITKLSPFLGALCVLSVLWVVNELFNRKLMRTDDMIQRRTPRVLQYGVIQMMLFVMGIMLALGVVKETGAFEQLMQFLAGTGFLGEDGFGIWGLGLLAGLASTVLDNFATAMTFFSFHDVNIQEYITALHIPALPNIYVQNGDYWKVVAYCVMVGGNLLTIGSMSGLALMKMERMHVGWYFSNIGVKALVGGLVGLAALWVQLELLV